MPNRSATLPDFTNHRNHRNQSPRKRQKLESGQVPSTSSDLETTEEEEEEEELDSSGGVENSNRTTRTRRGGTTTRTSTGRRKRNATSSSIRSTALTRRSSLPRKQSPNQSLHQSNSNRNKRSSHQQSTKSPQITTGTRRRASLSNRVLSPLPTNHTFSRHLRNNTSHHVQFAMPPLGKRLREPSGGRKSTRSMMVLGDSPAGALGKKRKRNDTSLLEAQEAEVESDEGEEEQGEEGRRRLRSADTRSSAAEEKVEEDEQEVGEEEDEGEAEESDEDSNEAATEGKLQFPLSSISPTCTHQDIRVVMQMINSTSYPLLILNLIDFDAQL